MRFPRWILRGAGAAVVWGTLLSLTLVTTGPEEDDGLDGGLCWDRTASDTNPWESDVQCAWGPFATEVGLWIAAPGTTFAPGAEIRLEGRVVNLSSKPVVVICSSPWVDYRVRAARDGDGWELSYTQEARIARYRAHRYESRHSERLLQLGDDAKDALLVSEWFDLSRPGRYQLVAVRRFAFADEIWSPWQMVRSNVLEIEISADLAVCSESEP